MTDGLAAPRVEAPATLAEREAPPRRRSPLTGWPAAVLTIALLAALAASAAGPSAGAVAPAAMTRLRRALISIDAPTRVDAVAVHGGTSIGRERERAALALLRDGSADTIVALGGPLPPADPDRSYAGAVRRRLMELEAPPDRVVTLPEGLSTRTELVALRQLAEARGWGRLALSTSSWHTLRVRLTAAEVFAGSGIFWTVVAEPEEEAAVDWWASRDRRLVILGEWLKIVPMVVWPSGGRI